MLKQVKYLLKLKAENFLDKRKKKSNKIWQWTWWRLGLALRGQEVVSPGWIKVFGRLYWRA